MKFARILLAISFACPVWGQNKVVLSGRVTDAITGVPIVDAAVSLNGRHVSYTDAGGNYLFAEVAPGAAQITIRADGFVGFEKTNPDEAAFEIPAERSEHNFRLIPAASITGKIIRDDPGPSGSIVATLFREVFTDGVRRFTPGGEREGVPKVGVSSIQGDGTYKFGGLEPGRYLVSAGPPAGAVTVFAGGKQFHPTEVQTYFPGTADFAAAIPVAVSAGEVRAVDFRVVSKPLFRVSGEIEATSSGEARQGALRIFSVDDGPLQHEYSAAVSIPGAFVVEGLPPGRYTAGQILITENLVPRESGTGALSFAMRWIDVDLPFIVTDHDVDGLKLVPVPVRPQLAVNGLFRMANDGTPLPTGLAVQFAYSEPGGRSDLIETAPNGTFWLTGPTGDYSVRPVIPAGYAVTEIRYGGGNYLNSLIPMRGDSLDSTLTIVLTNQAGAVTGLLVDGDQKPAAAHVVLAPETLPSDFDFRAFRVGSTDTKGAFVFGGLARGRYKAVVLTGDDRKRDHDLAILREKLAVADSFEVAAGQTLTIRLHP